MKTEKRSQKPGQFDPDLFDTAPLAPLGARHGLPDPPEGGGGSRDECGVPNSAVERAPRAGASADARIGELRRMGIGRVWVEVARTIGFEDFIAMWRVLDSLPDVVDERNRVCVPRFSTYLRYQRNELIRGMAARGHTRPQILQELRRQVGENLSEEHLSSILASPEA
jgi:hypothetical protein